MVYGWKHLTAQEIETIERGVLEDKAPAAPFFLELHPTNQCNAACSFCFTRHFREGQTLEWNIIEPMLAQAAAEGLRFLRLSGGGEPFVHPQAERLIDRCGQLGLRFVDINTNGILLQRHAAAIVDIGADYVFVSLNEPTAELYAKTMNVNPECFEKTVEAIRTLTRARDAAPPQRRPDVAVQFFVGPHNYRLIPQMYDLALQIGADRIVIKTPKTPNDAWQIPPAQKTEITQLFDQIIERDSLPHLLRLRFDLTYEDGWNHRIQQIQNRHTPDPYRINPDMSPRTPRCDYCYMGWFGPTVTATGNVYPCCMMHEMPGKQLGNIREKTLAQIWQGKPYQQFRTQMRDAMLLRGHMRYSRRHTDRLLPICIPPFACFFLFSLADDPFYERMARRMEKEFPPAQRAIAWARDRAIRIAQNIRARIPKRPNP